MNSPFDLSSFSIKSKFLKKIEIEIINIMKIGIIWSQVANSSQ